MSNKNSGRSRSLKNYIHLSRNGRSSRRYSRMSEKNTHRNPPASFLHQAQNFFTDNFLAWFVHDWWIRKRCPYPSVIHKSVYNLESYGEQPAPVTFCIAADWASATSQAAHVATAIREKKPDFTIHLGDTYYSGTSAELALSFGDAGNGLWPRGRFGSFALAGNHEMFSSGAPFLDMILSGKRGFGLFDPMTGKFSGQEASCFCVRTESWCILGLDTGYDSLKQHLLQRIFDRHPDNLDLTLPQPVITWLKEVVKIGEEKRGIIILTHHPYSSAFKEEKEFSGPAKQLQELLAADKEVIWLWGHEHRFSMYGKYRKGPEFIRAYGRCIGNGGMPDEHLPARSVDKTLSQKRNLVLYDHRTADTFVFENGRRLDIGYNGYATMSIDKERLDITYYAAYGTSDQYRQGYDQPIIRESWIANTTTNRIHCIYVKDYTYDNAQDNRVSYYGRPDPMRISQ